MADDKALVAAPQKAVDRRPDRTALIKHLVNDIIADDLKDVRLKKYAFMEDAELKALGFSARKIARIRQWELPKKEISMGMLASHERVTAFIRKQEGEKRIELNVQTAVIQLPQKAEDEGPTVVIDVEPMK